MKTSIGEKRETVDLNDMKNKKEHEIDNIRTENLFLSLIFSFRSSSQMLMLKDL